MDTNFHKLRTSRVILGLAISSFAVGTLSLSTAAAKDFESPEVLMLGDSQLSFGTGLEMSRFFDDFENRCAAHVSDKGLLKKINGMKKTLIGARSSTLRSWSTTKGGAYDKLCKIDPDWGVNASIWGHMRDKTRKYIQIGESENFDFCTNATPPVKAMFQQGYDPKLLLINILGNAASKWSGSPKGAELDLKGFIKLLPEDLPCVYIATMPSYTKKRNDRRFKAQNNLKKAMDNLGNRCTFVDTLDAKTIDAIEAHAKYFRRDKKGKVKDPFHPQQNAAALVLKIKEKQICQAVAQAVIPHWGGTGVELTALSTHEAGLSTNETELKAKTDVANALKSRLAKEEAEKITAKNLAKVEEPKVIEKPITQKVAVLKPAAPKIAMTKVNPVFLMVRTLPDDVSIESHKMAIQQRVTPSKALAEKLKKDLAASKERPVKASLQMPSMLIRGSVDLHFIKGDTNAQIEPVKVKTN